MTYASAKFEFFMSNGLGEDTITRNVMDGWMEEQQTGFGTKIIYHFI